MRLVQALPFVAAIGWLIYFCFLPAALLGRRLQVVAVAETGVVRHPWARFISVY